MASRAPNTVKGETRFGTASGLQSVIHVQSAAKSKGAVLALDAVAATGVRTTVYLWASSDGKLRIGTTLPADTEAGTIVGAQT